MQQDHLFHPDTRLLLAYGRTLAGRRAPATPAKAPHVLDRLAILERCGDGRFPLRSFGAELVELFGRDWKEQDFAELFLEPDWRLMAALIGSAAEAGEPGVARLKAETASGVALGFELVVMPLRLETPIGERFLCLMQPLGGQAFLDGRPLVRLRPVSLHPPAANAPPRIQVVVHNA
ncbi:MAG: PAS domain-containing protein [Alphaproteobacteria bacterium]|nr:PAS domain-containing protein [Alphaproteobacteria bacterium]